VKAPWTPNLHIERKTWQLHKGMKGFVATDQSVSTIVCLLTGKTCDKLRVHSKVHQLVSASKLVVDVDCNKG
jgi:hypothetical protein